MPSESTQFRKGQSRKAGPGRPKGSGNKDKETVRKFMRDILESKEYQAAFKERLIRGEAGSMENLAYHYAYGKPQSELDVRIKYADLTDEELTFLESIAPKLRTH